MNNFEVIEIIGVIFIICLQLWFFVQTKKRIALLRTIFPAVQNFSVTKIYLTEEEVLLHPKEVLENLEQFKSEGEGYDINQYISYEHYVDTLTQVDVLELHKPGNSVIDRIVYSLNTYLIRNRGVASDFHLIKDVVERNCDAVEDDIRQTLSVPLYLGLLGTFLGIIFGLLQISNVGLSSEEGALNHAIDLLLNGVKIAMFASFSGLALTVYNSAIALKGALSESEEHKNDFYTFIQTDLLPLLNQSINSTLYSLQTNLFKFNDEFKTNINRLGSVMGKNHEALLAQDRILQKLDTMDITELVKGNVKVFKELNTSVDKLAIFNTYLGQMGELVSSTRTFTEKVGKMIERTDDLGALGKSIVSTFEENHMLQQFLQSHYSSLDESRQLIARSVGEVGNVVDESLEQLKIFTQERISEVQQITLREIDLLQNQYPEKWQKLDSLSHLEAVSKNLSDIKMSTDSQMGSLTGEVKELNAKLQQAVAELERIKENGKNPWAKRIQGSFRKIFSKRA